MTDEMQTREQMLRGLERRTANSSGVKVKAIRDFLNRFIADTEPPALIVPEEEDANDFTNAWDAASKALSSLAPEALGSGWKFNLGDRVTKIKGSSWKGRVVGFYSTSLTPNGYAVESETETGSVQIYPEAALRPSSSGERR